MPLLTIGKSINIRERVLSHFSSDTESPNSKIKLWPFKGPIIISDGVNEKEHFLIDKWCFVGRLNEHDDIDSVNFKEINFDMDTYKILKRYLFAGNNFKNIREFTNTTIKRIDF